MLFVLKKKKKKLVVKKCMKICVILFKNCKVLHKLCTKAPLISKVFCYLTRDLVSNLQKNTCIIPADAESTNSLPFHLILNLFMASFFPQTPFQKTHLLHHFALLLTFFWLRMLLLDLSDVNSPCLISQRQIQIQVS